MINALALTGPTASGKTSLSLSLAEKLKTEIISCDSMQIYKEMNIGTAKATEEEQKRVKHYMIDFLSPLESYSAENYREDAMKIAKKISDSGKIPLFVGGTGLYIDTVMRGAVIESPPSDKDFHEKLVLEAQDDEGKTKLWERLQEVDPESAEKIHKNNVRRVARALEIYLLSGKTKSYFDKLSKEQSRDIHIGMITLDFHERDNLYRRVDTRVDLMVKEGLIEEVEMLRSKGLLKSDTTAGQAIGYKEICTYLDGKMSLEESLELLKMSSRRYAKRQLTWFRHEEEAERLFIDDENGVMKTGEILEKELYEIANSLISKFE